jgi:hypothetical protein
LAKKTTKQQNNNKRPAFPLTFLKRGGKTLKKNYHYFPSYTGQESN